MDIFDRTTIDADQIQDSDIDTLDNDSINAGDVDDTDATDQYDYQDNQTNNQNTDPRNDQNKKDQTQPNKQKKDRFEYWQSEATKFQNELKKYETYTPIVRYLQSNPDVIQALEAYLVGGQVPGQVAEPQNVQTEPEEMKAPVKPQMPKSYDPYDNDPNSESFKYREALDKYWEDKDSYRDFLLTKTITPYEKALQEQKTREAQLAQEQYAIQTLVQTRGWDASKAKGFIQFAQDPKNMSELPDYYEWKLARTQNPNQQVQPKKTNQAPSPIGAQPGIGNPPVDTANRFTQQLGGTHKDLFSRSGRR